MNPALLLACLLQGIGTSTAPVVINEFLYDHTGTDDREFVELYNRSGAAVDIGGWMLAAEDPTTTNPTYTIPMGTMLAAGDYYVLGSALVPNVDQVVGATNLWENDNESLTLKDSLGTTIDTLVYESNKGIWNAALAEGPGVYGNVTTPIALPGPMVHGRVRDGYDTDNNGYDFALLPQTPGTSNLGPSLLPLLENYDAAAVGSSSTTWTGSFVVPRVIDPATADANNPNAIALSPQGGNALIAWDPSGGGNASLLLSSTGDQFDVDAYVYFAAGSYSSTGIDQWESMSLGVGTTDTLGNHPNPGGFLSGMGVTGLVEANTGVAWTYIRFRDDPTGVVTNMLFLVDYNDGGGVGTTVLGSVPIVAGTNDGWQRLRLRVNGTKVEGWFGGTPGLNDGTMFSGTTAQRILGPVYIQYRELVSMNAETRPFTMDDLRIRRHGPGLDEVLPPSPCIGSGGCSPRIGWDSGTPVGLSMAPHAVTLTDAFPGGVAVLVVGLTAGPPFPMDLSLSFGGAPCWVLNDLVVYGAKLVAGPGPCRGTASIAVDLSGVPPGSGPVFGHWLLPDPGSMLGIPVTASDGISLTTQ
jgi:hypothetical protein